MKSVSSKVDVEYVAGCRGHGIHHRRDSNKAEMVVRYEGMPSYGFRLQNGMFLEEGFGNGRGSLMGSEMLNHGYRIATVGVVKASFSCHEHAKGG